MSGREGEIGIEKFCLRDFLDNFKLFAVTRVSGVLADFRELRQATKPPRAFRNKFREVQTNPTKISITTQTLGRHPESTSSVEF